MLLEDSPQECQPPEGKGQPSTVAISDEDNHLHHHQHDTTYVVDMHDDSSIDRDDSLDDLDAIPPSQSISTTRKQSTAEDGMYSINFTKMVNPFTTRPRAAQAFSTIGKYCTPRRAGVHANRIKLNQINVTINLINLQYVGKVWAQYDGMVMDFG